MWAKEKALTLSSSHMHLAIELHNHWNYEQNLEEKINLLKMWCSNQSEVYFQPLDESLLIEYFLSSDT